MKVENGSVLDQMIQRDKPFANAKAAVSFAKTAKTKLDALDKSVRVGQMGYEKDDLTAKSAVEEFQEKMENQMDASDRKN